MNFDAFVDKNKIHDGYKLVGVDKNKIHVTVGVDENKILCLGWKVIASSITILSPLQSKMFDHTV